MTNREALLALARDRILKDLATYIVTKAEVDAAIDAAMGE